MPLEQLGPYRIERLLGQGGMGSVYLGTHEESGQQAAVKTLSMALSRDEDFRVRFAGEIESLKKLRHPNIVQLYGWGEQDGVLFYSMEFIDGESLQERLGKEDRIEWREALDMGIDICKALKHAHDNGIIHRDLKPANLLRDRQHQIKLTDFGIAKLFGTSQVTVDGGVVGTADYMAPEQALGQSVTHRCDLYSLGSVLFTLLAGQPPFLAKSMPEVVHKVCYEPAQPVRRYNASVPPQLEALIGELLEKDPSRRPPTARALTARFEAMRHGLTETRDKPNAGLEPDDTDFEYTEPGKTLAPGDPRVHSATTRYARKEPPEDPAPATRAGETSGKPSEKQPARQKAELTEVLVKDATTPGAPPTPASESNNAATQKVRSGSRFTTIEEDAEASSQLQRQDHASQRWVVAALAAVLLVIGAFVGYQLLVPPSADALFASITQTANDDSTDLATASDEIDQFLALYSTDPRAEEVEQLREEIDLERLQKNFERRGRRLSASASLTSTERAYLEAVEIGRTQPEAALARFQAIIDLYGGDKKATDSNQRVVALAQRQIDRLQAALESNREADLQELKDQLQTAHSIEETRPAEARAMYEGVILLYQESSWAEEAVAQAKAGLARLESR